MDYFCGQFRYYDPYRGCFRQGACDKAVEKILKGRRIVLDDSVPGRTPLLRLDWGGRSLKAIVLDAHGLVEVWSENSATLRSRPVATKNGKPHDIRLENLVLGTVQSKVAV